MGIKMVNRRCSVAPTNPGWVALILYTASLGSLYLLPGRADMRLRIEVEFDVTNDGDALDAVRFQGGTLNLIPHMDAMTQIKLQAELECALERAIVLAREREEIAGDYRRELARDLQREALLEGAAQRRLGA